MIQNSYIIFESQKAAEDFWIARELAPMKEIKEHYISEEVASVNLEMAILYLQAYIQPFS